MKKISITVVPVLGALVSACNPVVPPPVDVPSGVDAFDVVIPMDSVTTDRPNVVDNDASRPDVTRGSDAPDASNDSGVCPPRTTSCGMFGCLDLQNNAAHCGVCDRTCPMNQLCVAGVCRADCPMPNSVCGAGASATCVNLQTDSSNCGMCGNVCPPVNGVATCNAGVCAMAGCNAGFADCDLNAGNGCETNIASSITDCGMCGAACPAPVANSTSQCRMGACAIVCNRGFELLGAECVPMGAAPRPIVPISLGDVSIRRPTLRWELPPGADGALVELCRDRACTMVIESIRALGSSVRPTLDLPANSVVFWRMRATMRAATSATFSPTWLFHTPARDNSGAIDTSTSPHVDVNGDGFDDVLVGAPRAAPGGRVGAGTAALYHGSAMGVAAAPARVFEGVAASDAFGFSVSGAGDLNGDGFGDLVVGAESASPGGRVRAGTASVYYGSVMGAAMVPSLVLEGVAGNDRFGYSVASAGDVNSDGYGDLLVGARGAAPGGRASAGTVSVYYGTAMGIAAMPTGVLEGPTANAALGNSVATAGDVNGDGFSDVIAGAIGGASAGGVNTGTASVYYGSVMGLAMAPSRVLAGIGAGDSFGNSVSGAGDVNNDGYSDVVVGAVFAMPSGRVAAGTASVYHGSVMGIPMAPARVIEGAVANALGYSVSSAGDVNNDGFDDLVVGATGAAPGGRPSAGIAGVYHGSAMGIGAAATRVLEGTAGGDGVGSSVAGADVNGDGFCDVIVGASNALTPGGIRSGTANVYHGGAMGIPVGAARILEGPAVGSAFGAAVAHRGEGVGLRGRSQQRLRCALGSRSL